MKLHHFYLMEKCADIVPAYRLNVGDKFHPWDQKFLVPNKHVFVCVSHTEKGDIKYTSIIHSFNPRQLAGRDLVQKI